MADWDPVVTYDPSTADYWNTQLFVPGTVKQAGTAATINGSLVNFSFTRTTPVSTVEDVAIFSFHVSVRPGGAALYDSLTEADAVAFEGAADAQFTTNARPFINSGWTFSSYTWRNWGADYPLDENGFSKPGPIWRVSPKSLVGQGGGFRLPDQLASTVTLKTASRKHWGRVYIGGLETADLQATFGRLTTACVDGLTAFVYGIQAAIGDLSRVQQLVVYSTRYRGVLSLTSVQADDVCDVIRSRRAKQPLYRSELP